MNNKTTMEITNLSDMSTAIGQFDYAVEKPLFYGDTFLKAENYKAIYNMNKGVLAQVVSKNYQIIQHNDTIQAVVEELAHQGIEVKGRIDNFGNMVRADLVFDNKGVPIKDDETGVKLGMRVFNSYNKTTSFRLELYGFRMICQNGMSLGTALHSIKEVVFHMGKEKNIAVLKDTVRKFINNVFENNEKLQTYINESRGDVASWESITQLIEKSGLGKKVREKILTELGIATIEVEDQKTKKKTVSYVLDNDNFKNINRWDLYNVLTAYATHTEKISNSSAEFTQLIAQKILTTKYEQLVEVQA